ncbi:MAG: MFS transporter [Anaeromicrobium sp.]|jgi:predicted MFS family arabinose efflux permease|uniref:MFS transporter n=1 Tax=Anaeromicrobium sp. TaxID=1929132 RepID=UPI0025E05AD8|nr:MFS transporter [Anaeromicrobium sp.]MCT4595446.1 MFS transporter [Anaeromicrobium sp.]
MNIIRKLNFDKKTLLHFMVVAVGSQLMYAINSIRSVLYEPFKEALGVNNAQLGFLLSLIGIVSTIMYVPGGWFQDRFSNRKLLSINLFITGICGFYLAIAPSYNGALMVFALFGLTQEAFYWAAVLKSIRTIAPDDKQGTAFGALELVRGGTEFATNGLAILIFSVVGQSVLGVKVALGVDSALIIIMAIITWVILPEEIYIKAETAKEKNKLALKGLIKVLSMPEVWFVGITAGGIYTIYIGLTYFLPFLQNVYHIPVGMVAIFGLVNTSVTRMISSPLAGLIGDNKFKSSTHFMRLALGVTIIFLGMIIIVPKKEAFMIPALIILMGITILCYMLRGVYYAPIGELNMPKAVSGSAMSVAAFLGYSPMFWAYATYGSMIDKYDPSIAYNRIYMIQLCFAVTGFIISHLLCKRIEKKQAENKTA